MSLSEKLKQYFAPQPIEEGVRVRDVVRELPGAVKKVNDKSKEFLQDVAQGTARAVASVGITAGNVPTRVVNRYRNFGKKLDLPFDKEIPTKGSKFAQFMFGDTSIKDLETYGKAGLNEIDSWRRKLDVDTSPINPIYAYPLAALGVVTELSGLGGTVKKGITLTDDVVEFIAKSKSGDEIQTALTKMGDIDAATAKELAPQLVNAKSREEVLSVTDSLRDRGFTTSVNKQVPERPVTGTQILTRSTDDLAIRASNLVKSDIDAAERVVRAGADENAVAVASELIKKYTNDARLAKSESEANIFYDKVADISNEIAEKLTAMGRGVQAATILARTTPEGQLRFAARTIQQYNQKNPTRKIKDLSAEDSKYILDEMKAIEAMEDGFEKAIRYRDLQNYTLDKIPTPLWKKVTTVWQAGLLTGLKTTGLNLASTANNISLRAVSKVPAVIFDKAISVITGERSVALTMGVTKDGLKEGFSKGVRYFKTGFDERNLEEAYNFRRVSFGKGKVGKLFQTYTDTVFRVLGAQDQFFYYGALAASVKEQAVVRAINMGRGGDNKYIDFLTENPDERMMTAAVVDAVSATFQNKTRLGEFLSAAREAGGPIGHFAIPFARTPSAVAMEVIHYSPIGALEAAYMAIKGGENFDQRRLSTLLGKSFTGTFGAAWLGFSLYDNDRVTLEYPSTSRERALWEAEGRKANSVLINGKWRSPYVLGPNGVLLLWGAHLKRALDEKGSVAEATVNASLGMGQSFMEQTALTGVNQLAEALNNPSEMGAAYVAGLVSSFVPTLVSDVGRSVDPNERDTKGETFTERVSNRVQARIPIARQSLPEKVDVFGYDIKRIGNFFEMMADPTRPSRAFTSPIMDEVRRLHEEGYNAAPTKLNYYPTLTPAQQVDLFRLGGTRTEEYITELMQTSEYRKADDEKRAALIDREMTKAKVDARAIMLVIITANMAGETRTKRIAELWEDGLVTEAVYKRYKELR